MRVVCPACDEQIGEVTGQSFIEELVLSDALGLYHMPLCRAPRADYYGTRVVWGSGEPVR